MSDQGLSKSIEYKLSARDLRQLQNMFDQSDVKGYFQKIDQKDSANQALSRHYSQQIQLQVDYLLREGTLNVGLKKRNVEQFLRQQKINEEEQKTRQLKMKREYIQKQLSQLRNQKSKEKKIDKNKEIQKSKEKIQSQKEEHDLILTREEHEKLVKKLVKDRKERQKQHSKFLSDLGRKQKQGEQKSRKQQQQKQNEEKRKRRQNISKNLVKHKEQHQQFLQQQKRSLEKYEELKSKKFLYQQIEDKYTREILLPALQDKKQKLKEIRQFRTFNIQQLKEHERSYLQKRQTNQSHQSKIVDWGYHPPARSERLQTILEEERLEKIKKLQDKKKIIDQKLNRQQDYVSYLRQNFKPTIDPAKRLEIEMRLQKKKPQKVQLPDMKSIGIEYLQQAKKKRKKITKNDGRPETERNATISVVSKETKSRAITNYLSQKRHDQPYQRLRRRNLEKLINTEQLSNEEKIKRLRMESEKINENIRMKEQYLKYKKDDKVKEETLQLLLSSIQAKIGIIQVYK